MIRLTMSIDATARLVRQGLQNLRAEVPKIGKLRMFEAMKRIIAKMQRYPAPPSGSTYRRTYHFRAGWRLIATGNGYRISNVVPYAKYPVGSAYGTNQAWMHVGRWQLFRDVADAEMEQLPKTIQANISMVARRSFGA